MSDNVWKQEVTNKWHIVNDDMIYCGLEDATWNANPTQEHPPFGLLEYCSKCIDKYKETNPPVKPEEKDSEAKTQDIVDKAAKKELSDNITKKQLHAIFKCYVLLQRHKKVLEAKLVLTDESIRKTSGAIAQYAANRGKIASIPPDNMSKEELEKIIKECDGEIITVKI